jgi:hypothetical protein
MFLSLLVVALAALGALAVRRRLLAAAALWEEPGADFLAFQQHLEGETGLAVNPEATVLCLAQVGRPPRLLAPEQLLGLEVIEDGAVVLRRDRTGRWDGWERDDDVRAQHQRVSRLALRITFDDPAGPSPRTSLAPRSGAGEGAVHLVSFLEAAVSKDSSAYLQAVEQVQHWFRVVETVLARARPAAAERGLGLAM